MSALFLEGFRLLGSGSWIGGVSFPVGKPVLGADGEVFSTVTKA